MFLRDSPDQRSLPPGSGCSCSTSASVAMSASSRLGTDPARRPALARASSAAAALRIARAPARVSDTSRVRASRPGRDRDQPALDQRIERARQRGAVEEQRAGEIRHPRRAMRRERAQQRELRDAQARRRHQVVVELRQRARRAAQPAAGAGGSGKTECDGIGEGSDRTRAHMHANRSICTFLAERKVQVEVAARSASSARPVFARRPPSPSRRRARRRARAASRARRRGPRCQFAATSAASFQ